MARATPVLKAIARAGLARAQRGMQQASIFNVDRRDLLRPKRIRSEEVDGLSSGTAFLVLRHGGRIN
eukprot:8424153-Alexandrium_andersonii.AAC.1